MTAPQWRRRIIDRRPGQAIHVDGPARIEVLDLFDRRVRLAVEAPPETRVERERGGDRPRSEPPTSSQ